MNRGKASSRTRNRRETLKKAPTWRINLKRTRYAALLYLFLLFYPLYPTPAAADDKIHAFTLLQINDTYDLFPVPMEMGHRTVFRGGMAHAAALIKKSENKSRPSCYMRAIFHEVMEARVGKTLITKAGENTTGLGVIDVEAARSGRRWVIEKSGRRWRGRSRPRRSRSQGGNGAGPLCERGCTVRSGDRGNHG